MNDIWAIASEYPTGIFTIINLVLIGYWLLVAIGLMDFDFFDLDVDTDTSVDDIGGFATFLATLGFTGVPVTIVLTILFFCAWGICYIGAKLLLSWLDISMISVLLGTVILIASFIVAIPVTNMIVRPLRKLFRKLYAESNNQDLVGRPVKVRSSRVDATFGEAVCAHKGASLLLKVRTATPEKIFTRGDVAVLVEYNSDKHIYYIVDQKEFETN
ncbi:MAG: DUF1449 family protein [Gammaproteobacteria bacterium]|nr:DUF1449 family protein [Gammaproteobacteria bacterium]